MGHHRFADWRATRWRYRPEADADEVSGDVDDSAMYVVNPRTCVRAAGWSHSGAFAAAWCHLAANA